MDKRKPLLGAKLSAAKERIRKRASGWKTCPVCDGMGDIWNRFTHERFVCPMCQGETLINPKE